MFGKGSTHCVKIHVVGVFCMWCQQENILMANKPNYGELEQKVRELEKEITGYKQAEEKISKLSGIFSHLGGDPKKNIDIIVQQTCEILEGVCSIYNRLDDKKKSLYVSSGCNLPSDFDREDTPDGHICYEATINGKDKPVILEDLEGTTYEETDPNVKKYGLESYLGFPVLLGGKTIGSLCIVDMKKRNFTPTEVNIISTLAKAVSLEEERKQAEMALRTSEEKYRLVIENANETISVAQDGMIKFVNLKATELTGYTGDELTSTPFSEFIHQDDREMVLEHQLKRLRGEDLPHIYSFRIVDKGGNEKYVEINAIRIDWDGAPATLNFMSDIAAHKHAEESLRENNERFKSLFSASPIGIKVYDSDGQLIDANKASLRIFGRPDLSKIKCPNLFNEPFVPDAIKKRLSKHYPVRYEYSLNFERVKQLNLFQTTKTGGLTLDVMITPLAHENEPILGGYLVQLQDISDRKRAEQRIRALSQELMRAQENERQMISLELHDRVAQDLSTLKIACDTFFESQTTVPTEVRQKILELSKIVQGTIITVRDLAYDLSPPGLDDLDPVETIFGYCQDFSEKNGVSIDFSSAGVTSLKLDFDTKSHLFRMIQEGLNNIKRHAAASHVVIRLVAAFPHIMLRIEDDGKGFDVKDRKAAALDEKRMGLRSMEERVSLLQGKMTIESRPMQGTKIFIKVPYEQKSNR